MGISQLGGASTRLVVKAGASGVTTLPNITGVSRGVGDTNQTYGLWTQIVASTSVEYMLVGVTAFRNGVTGGQFGPIFVDIGSGASGSEAVLATVPIFGAQPDPSSAAGTRIGGHREITPIRVPAGTRLAFRAALYFTTGSGDVVFVSFQAVPTANLE